MSTGDLVERHEADVVPVARIAETGISETGEKQHDKAPRSGREKGL
jgi:hypothetical protein